MAKALLRIRDLGQAGAHAVFALAQNSTESPLRGKTALLSFEDAEPAEFFARLIRSAGGEVRTLPADRPTVIPENPQTGERFAGTADCLLAQGRRSRLEALGSACPVPVINAADEADEPLTALAGLLAASRLQPDFSRLRVAWWGGSPSEANAWIEAALYFPFELFMAVSPAREPDGDRLGLALQAGARIFLTDEPRLALDGSVWANRSAAAFPGIPTFAAGEKERALAAVLGAVMDLRQGEQPNGTLHLRTA